MDNENKSILAVGLKSKDANTVIATIQKIREDGEDFLLEELVQVYESSSNQDIKQKIYALFCDLSIQTSAKTIVSLIENEKYSHAQKMLVSSCWQTRLNYLDFLETFILLVINKPFDIAFEAFTVIENIEVKVSNLRKIKLVEFAKTNFKKVAESNMDLAHELVSVIQNFEEE